MKKSHILLLSLFIIVVLTVLSYGSKIAAHFQQKGYGKNKVNGKYYSIRGFQMYCERYGEGKPLLLIHGNGGNIGVFKKQIPYFSKHYNVIVADSRAQGKSIDASDSLTYEMMADDYAALLTELHIDSALVIGWSDGGINGLLLAMRHPEKVKKLVISGANLQPDASAVDTTILNEIMPNYLRLKALFADKKVGNATALHEYKLMKLLIEQPHIPLTDLHKITAPTLVIAGDHDLILPSHTLQLFQHLPNAYLWILPNAGHATLIDYANEFNEKVEIFFNVPYKKAEK